MFKFLRKKISNANIDFTLQKGDVVTNKHWTLTPLIIVDLNWALRAAALKLGDRGDIVVWPIEGLKKVKE